MSCALLYGRAHTQPRLVQRGRKSGYAPVGMTKGRIARPFRFDDGEDEQQVPPLRYPGFPVGLVALSHFMRPSLRKGAYAASSSAAWQEIRVRSGRDDTSVRVGKSV